MVSLDELVVRAETARLATAVRDRAVDVSAIVWNRVKRAPLPLPTTVTARQFCAEESQPSPVGVFALREWAKTWQVVLPHS